MKNIDPIVCVGVYNNGKECTHRAKHILTDNDPNYTPEDLPLCGKCLTPIQDVLTSRGLPFEVRKNVGDKELQKVFNLFEDKQ